MLSVFCLFVFYSLKARGVVYINLPWYSTLSLYGDGRVYLLVNHAESADRYINVNTHGRRVTNDIFSFIRWIKNELLCNKTNKITSAPSEDSDQVILIRFFTMN